GTPPVGKRYGGLPESDEHKRLKAWVASHPDRFGISATWGKGEPEHELLSGDTVDVVFSDGLDFVLIEVKSCRSNDDDYRRGIYQCVKYRSVKEAERLPHRSRVRSILVTERKLEATLAARARLLGIRVICVKVNK
ncbi:MAG: hypothetical protein KF766_15560, partial [Rhodocyclaceae bacterium]|nr:hypothetical protein [Rhodocyclaceae bacterium]